MKTLEAIVTEVDHGNRVWKFVLSHWKAIVKSREQMRQCFKRQEVMYLISLQIWYTSTHEDKE